MDRFTISLESALASKFDMYVSQRGYVNRSEAVRDLIREKLDATTLAAGQSEWCAATVSYVYDRSDPTVVLRVLQLKHDHHDIVVASQHAPLDHQHCLETVILRGATRTLMACADRMMALRGVHHGSVHVMPLHQAAPHSHGEGASMPHYHLEPAS